MIFKVAQIVPSSWETKGLHDIGAENKRPATKVQNSLLDVEVYDKTQKNNGQHIYYNLHTTY